MLTSHMQFVGMEIPYAVNATNRAITWLVPGAVHSEMYYVEIYRRQET